MVNGESLGFRLSTMRPPGSDCGVDEVSVGPGPFVELPELAPPDVHPARARTRIREIPNIIPPGIRFFRIPSLCISTPLSPMQIGMRSPHVDARAPKCADTHSRNERSQGKSQMAPVRLLHAVMRAHNRRGGVMSLYPTPLRTGIRTGREVAHLCRSPA